jgi:dihydrofolate reductase
MIVLSSDPDYHAYGCAVASSLEQALESTVVDAVTSEIMVIGGASVFKQTLPLSHRLYLTRVDADLPGDTWFPYWNPNEWRLLWEETHSADDRHAWSFRLQKLERIILHHIDDDPLRE